jgi:hypothetical protein
VDRDVTPIAKREVDANFWTTWSSAPALDQSELRDNVLALVASIQDAAYHDEWERIKQCRRLFNLGAVHCTEEPYRSAYDYGAMLIAVLVADCELAKANYAAVHSELALVRRMLVEDNPRRQAAGLPPRGNSEVRFNSLGVLAGAKWEGPEALRDVLMTPDEIVAEFKAVAARVETFFKENPREDPALRRNTMEALALAHLEVSKMAFRYCPAQVGGLVVDFNRLHSGDLALEPGHYRTQALSDSRSSYYWDFELAKLYLGQQLTSEDLHICVELRAMAARRTFGQWPLTGLYRKWRRQSRDMYPLTARH